MIVAFTGNKQSGKDTCGDYLAQFGYARIAFADPLKQACAALFLFDDEQLYGSKKEVVDEYWGYSPRQLMQWVGTECLRQTLGKLAPKIGERIHIRNCELRMVSSPVAITDLRFKDEEQMLREYGKKHGRKVIVIRITRNPKSEAHRSESEGSSIEADYTIDNNGTLDELYASLRNILGLEK